MLVIREGESPIELKTGDEPFEVFILCAFALWGVYGTLSLSKVTTATASTIPTWGAYVFYGVLGVGCTVSLVGIVYQVVLNKILGFYIERSGLQSLIGLCAAYSVWAWAASTWKAVGFILVLGGIGGACGWRIRRINRGLRAVTSAGAP